MSRHAWPCLLALALVGCAQPATFGERLSREGGKMAALGEDWSRGEAMVARGERLIDEGDRLVDRGRDKREQGRELVDRGERLMRASERGYRDVAPVSGS